MNEKIINLARRAAFYGVSSDTIKKIFNRYLQEMTVSEIIEFGKEVGKYLALRRYTLVLIEKGFSYTAIVCDIEHISSAIEIDENDIKFISESITDNER